MPKVYSHVVENILKEWLDTLENEVDTKEGIDLKLISQLRKLVEEGQIGSQAQIKQLIDGWGASK